MEIRADYIDEQNFMHIDMWPFNDNEDGRTIAIICCDTHKVFFIDNTMRNDYWVQETIKDVLLGLEKEKQSN